MHADFAAAKTVVVAHYTGMTVAEITELRKKMSDNCVVRNSPGAVSSHCTPEM